MAAERPDIKLHFDEAHYEALKVYAGIDGKALKKFCEDIINEHLAKRIADTNLAHAQIARLGFDGFVRDLTGKP